ncbi:MAG: hypothetical protein AAB069_02110 [Planctomycetota bacterium]
MLLKTVTRITDYLAMVCIAMFSTQVWGGALTDAEMQLIFIQALDDASIALPTELDSKSHPVFHQQSFHAGFVIMQNVHIPSGSCSNRTDD